tara:strand:- start:3006 stop:3713 length:708 start_codon:yes stop_codon:yes gene_type:complete
MTELILTSYQAKVFGEVEQLLKTRGNPNGVQVNPKAYYLSKRIAVYIINNISKNQTNANVGVGETSNDAENVYNWVFGITPSSPAPIVDVSDTGTTTGQIPSTHTIELSRAYTTLNDALSDDLSLYNTLGGGVIGALTTTYIGTISANKILTKTAGDISFPNQGPFDFNTLRLDNNFVYFFKIAQAPTLDGSISTGDVLEVNFDITGFNTTIIPITLERLYTGGVGELKVKSIIK